MKRVIYSAAGVLLLSLGAVSCDKHEVIPAPVPMVDLECYFKGKISGGDVELTQNVEGYTCTPTNPFQVNGTDSKAQYYSEIGSAQTPRSISIGVGSIYWNANSTAKPSEDQFTAFFLGLNTPSYSQYAFGTPTVPGFEVIYRDLAGRIWSSREVSVNPQSVTISGATVDSDTTGMYAQLTCNFSCWVYSTVGQPEVTDSLHITNAMYQGWFKR